MSCLQFCKSCSHVLADWILESKQEISHACFSEESCSELWLMCLIFCDLFYFVFFNSSNNEWLYVKIIQIFIKILNHNYSFIQNQNNSKFLQLIQHIISLILEIMISAFQSELNTMLLISRMYFLAFFACLSTFKKFFHHVQTVWILRIWYFMR